MEQILTFWLNSKYHVLPETIEMGTSPWLIQSFAGEPDQSFFWNNVAQSHWGIFAAWQDLR